MNSDRIIQNYANSDEMKFGAHYVTLISDKVSYENPVGKFALKYVTPDMNSTSAFNNVLSKNNTSNVINKDHLGVDRITSSNYIELSVPMHYFYITNLVIQTNTYPCSCECGGSGLGGCNPIIIITRKEYYKGQKFIIVNAGGEIDTPCIVGVV